MINILQNKFSTKPKEALGLAVSGTEVRLAHLVSERGRVRIEGLERAKLRSSLEAQKTTKKTAEPQETENNDMFGLKNTTAEKSPPREDYQHDDANLEVLYELLGKFTKKRIKIAFNVPLSMVSYQPHTPLNGAMNGSMSVVERLGGADKEASLTLAQHLLKSADGAAKLNMFYEKNPPTMSLLLGIKGYTKGNLYLGQMQTTELALLSLARASLPLEQAQVTAIVYIEEDFSRLIFLRGHEVLHISSLINENASSPEVLDVLYRRLIYEQDEAQIPEINTILITGKGGRVRAKDFFAKHCTGVEVSYLATDKLGSFPANETQRAIFSEFAVAIGLAWQLLEPKNSSFVPIDLLPADIKDQQEVLKLGYPGYALLGLTGLVAFFFTWQILVLRNDTETIRSKNYALEQQIQNNQATVDRVHLLENECKRLGKNLSLADTLSKGYDEFLQFTQKLNTSVRRTGGVWVEEISRHKTGFSIRGGALQRERIPLLAERLEQASLRQVTRAEGGKQKFFQFELERQNLQSKYAFSAGGIRIIDSNERGNGNLILGKEGETPNAATAPRFETKTQSSAPPPAREQSSSKTSQVLSNGVIKEASAKRPAPNAQPAPDKNRAATPTGPATTTRTSPNSEQRKVAAPPNKMETGVVSGQLASKEKIGVSEGVKAGVPQSSATNGTTSAPTSKEAKPAPPLVNKTSGATTTPLSNGTKPAAAQAQESADANQAGKTGVPLANGTNATTPVAANGTKPAAPLAQAEPKYRWYSIEAATSPRQDFMVELKDAYVRQGYKAALGTYYDAKLGAKAYRVLIGLYKSSAAAEQTAAEMGKLLMQGYRIVGIE